MLKLLAIILPAIGFALGVYGSLKTKGPRMVGIIILSFILPFISGFLWYMVCNALHWDDRSSGTSGLRAFVWGVTTILPISLFTAGLTFGKTIHKTSDLLPFLKSRQCFGAVLIAIMAGVGALVFYNIDFRGTIGSLPYEQLELYTVLIWSAIITASAAMVLFFKGFNLRKSSMLSVVIIPVLSAVICFIGLKIYFLIIVSPQNDPGFIIRGFTAGYCLRFGLFYGLLFSMDTEYYRSLLAEVKAIYRKKLNKPLIPTD